jgi:hypothetical protein
MKVDRGKTNSRDEKEKEIDRECLELIEHRWPEETELLSSLLEYELCNSLDALEKRLSSSRTRGRRTKV